MISVYVHQRGETRKAARVEPEWLGPSSDVTMWVDLSQPTSEEARLLSEVFHFHPLSIEDALSEIHHPKVELYDGYLYLILHGIDFQEEEHWFATHDVDFFLGRNYLLTVHDGRSRSILRLHEVCERHDRVLADGPAGVMHRIVDAMVDHYRPEVAELEGHVDSLEEEAVLGLRDDLIRDILGIKRDIGSFRRVAVPQRDAIGRLARREFALISDEMAYRFRDVYDQLVRLSDEAMLLQDRVSGMLDAYLSTVSNRLNRIVKVLTVMSTIFLPLTVLTGMWGMNIPLPLFPGGEAVQFWWIAGIMASVSIAMLAMFRRNGWI
jgi:magnesium transporter